MFPMHDRPEPFEDAPNTLSLNFNGRRLYVFWTLSVIYCVAEVNLSFLINCNLYELTPPPGLHELLRGMLGVNSPRLVP